ncbi:hypothetical protein CHLRE_01g055200v5 [Chlamydomonas reinhardtii]|uniref:SS18 N-terminal domain-containing protein n=1 Tax=Chlamydomonas reinhardtii TaxID=3055 RepID=A8JCQ2_CHLRE|nr:uncharacterized protein CHLRE_01g055200v5 [Chlamydomonas reinhardtii]PNW89023.1 hypothetical protein CHLRE_01g055200v5 [Chlamydomonas reinhardtii]|eukprot:XP_001700227.1 GIF3-like protein [Chlamydomonas reinhardtii]
MAAASKPPPMTTDKIQDMLEENFKFIKAIAEQQNLGRVQEVHQYQQKLQENLMLLAAVADTYSNSAAAAQPGGEAGAAAPAAATARPPTAPGAPLGAPGAPPPAAPALTPQQIHAAVQQALAMKQQQQQQQQQQPQQPQQSAVAQYQQPPQAGLPIPGGMAPGQGAPPGFTLPAPPPLNLAGQ